MPTPAKFDRADLDARLAAAKPGDTAFGMFFSGIVKYVEAQGDKARAAALKERHGRDGWSDLKSYPATTFIQLMFDVVDAESAKGANRDDALRNVGYACTKVFFGTITGKVLLTLWARGGPSQMVPNISKAFGMSVHIGERSYVPVSPTSGRVQFRSDLLPPLFSEGCILAAFDAINSKGKVQTEVLSTLDVDFHIDWSA